MYITCIVWSYGFLYYGPLILHTVCQEESLTEPFPSHPFHCLVEAKARKLTTPQALLHRDVQSVQWQISTRTQPSGRTS